ncbi:MAG: hypothetical protein OXI67_04830 [Candidatus Poribacteria bacterium]|nr:hypothetical protein [Candidatus Poribacteria bacterium]
MPKAHLALIPILRIATKPLLVGNRSSLPPNAISAFGVDLAECQKRIQR